MKLKRILNTKMSAKGAPVFTLSLPKGAARSLAPRSVTPLIIYTSIIQLYDVCFWIRDNQRYSKVSYISVRNKSWLCCGLSHVLLKYSHCFKIITFLKVYHRVKCRSEAV